VCDPREQAEKPPLAGWEVLGFLHVDMCIGGVFATATGVVSILGVSSIEVYRSPRRHISSQKMVDCTHAHSLAPRKSQCNA
jgi:hypothetical protein